MNTLLFNHSESVMLMFAGASVSGQKRADMCPLPTRGQQHRRYQHWYVPVITLTTTHRQETNICHCNRTFMINQLTRHVLNLKSHLISCIKPSSGRLTSRGLFAQWINVHAADNMIMRIHPTVVQISTEF